MRRLTVRMATELHEKLRKISYEEYRPVNRIIIEAIKLYLEMRKGEGNEL